MPGRHRNQPRQLPASFRSGNRGRFHRFLLAGLAAMLVAGPLVIDEPSNLGNGLALAMLWLLLLCLWVTSQLKRNHLVLRWSGTDVGLAVMFVLMNVGLAAAAWAGRIGLRPALNALFAWTGILVGYFLFRQLIDTGRAARALVAAMISASAMVAVFGLFQYFVTIPADQEAYRQNPRRTLLQAGIDPDQNPRQRAGFEQRLLNSSEPFGTFTLTNSLAGFLAPWLVLLAGIAVAGGLRQGWTRLAAFAFGGTIALCLVLTKSRTAYVAAAVCLVLMWLVCRTEFRRAGSMLAAMAGVAGLLLLLVAGLGGIDLPVATEAWRSLTFRFEYWQATLGMIGDYPLWGSGLGNFGDYYTQYKLPQASEEVADPHNFLFEVWSTAGTPAVLCLLAALGAWLVRVARPHAADEETADWPETDDDPTLPIAVGSVCGLGVAWFAGVVADLAPNDFVLLAGLIVLPLGALAFRPWVLGGKLPAGALAVSAGAVLIHLLGAGGISAPGVATSLWLLVALSLNTVEARQPRSEWSGGSSWGALLVAVGLSVACYALAYLPVTTSRAAQPSPNAEPADRLRQWSQAYQADPYAYEPAQALAKIHFRRWRQNRSSQDLAEFERYKDAMLARRGHAWMVWAQTGTWYTQAHRAQPAGDYADRAVAAFRRAAELYPGSASLHGQLALALAAAGDPAAVDQAIEALRLDQAMPHEDKQLKTLDPELLTVLERIAPATD